MNNNIAMIKINNILLDLEKTISQWEYERGKVNKDVLFILRHKIDKPLKGNVTKGKLRWRGIGNIVTGPKGVFIGIIQRDNVVGVDGFIAKINDSKSLENHIEKLLK